MTENSKPGLGAFRGVFRPVFLTILGALFYLREGWLVGNAGLIGAVAVIVLSTSITGLTSLSMSSIATNVRVRAGGAFAIISAALGIDVGGSVGVPLYLAQTLSSVLYVYAFSEAWRVLFPSHSGQVVAIIAMIGVSAVVLRSVSVAARLQGGLMLLVLSAMASIFGGWLWAEPLLAPTWIGSYGEASLLECFVIFFPAATGIMVGVGMSGELENPSRSIPRGTLAAWGVTSFVYLLGAVWYATIATPQELLQQPLVAMNHAVLGPVVLFGLFASTLMAALSSLVAAPRLLQAMASYEVVPLSGWLAQTHNDAPRNATLLTIGLAALGLFAGSLNALAPVITGIFVTTFLVINLAVLLEELLGMISWRPLFRVGTAVPAVGVGLCAVTLGVASPLGGLPELAAVAVLYLWLVRHRQQGTPWETVQSGMVQTLAYRAALRALSLDPTERSWRPDLLVRSCEGYEPFPIWERMVARHGSLQLVTDEQNEEGVKTGRRLVEELRSREVLASLHPLDLADLPRALDQALSAFQGTVGAPTTVAMSAESLDTESLRALVEIATRREVGLIFFVGEAPSDALGRVNVWVSDRSPDWPLSQHMANLDLQLLVGLLLTLPSGGLRLTTVVRDHERKLGAVRFFRELVELGRVRAEVDIRVGSFAAVVGEVEADLHVFGLPEEPELSELVGLCARVGAPCLFVKESGRESVLV